MSAINFKTLGEETVAKAKKWGADEVEVFLENGKGFNVDVRNGDIESLQKSAYQGLGLRIFVNKQFGFGYTSDLTAGSVDETIKRTIELARLTESKPWQGLPDFGPQPLSNLDLYDSELAGVPDATKIATARQVEKIALSLDKRITNSYGASFSNSEREAGLFNSKGISCVLKVTSCGFSIAVIAGEGNNMQSGGWSSSKRFYKELEPIESVAKIAVQRTVEQLGPKPVPTKKVPVVFDRYAAPAFWSGILGALNGDAVFRKATFLTNSLNQEIASPMITVVDDPTIPRFVGSSPYDGEGNVTRRNVIIDKGVLKMFLYDSQIARKAGVKVNTMAGRGSYRFLPSASFLNVIVQNGTDSFDSLLKGMKEGLYVKGLRGSGTDATTGAFSVGCNGFWIENGALAFPVDGVTLGGTTLEILKQIDKVADNLDMRGSLNSPSFRVGEITVGGKKA